MPSVTEQLPKLAEEQVKTISNLKIDNITAWDGGKGGDGKTAKADFVSGLVRALPEILDERLSNEVGSETAGSD
jgi:flotillin